MYTLIYVTAPRFSCLELSSWIWGGTIYILQIERCSILMFSSCAHKYIDKDNNLKVAIDLIQKHFEGHDLPIKQLERTWSFKGGALVVLKCGVEDDQLGNCTKVFYFMTGESAWCWEHNITQVTVQLFRIHNILRLKFNLKVSWCVNQIFGVWVWQVLQIHHQGPI